MLMLTCVHYTACVNKICSKVKPYIHFPFGNGNSVWVCVCVCVSRYITRQHRSKYAGHSFLESERQTDGQTELTWHVKTTIIKKVGQTQPHAYTEESNMGILSCVYHVVCACV